MNKLFIHNAFFRLIAPVVVGCVVYVLILLINNNIEQLQEAFFGEELYLCIGLAYVIQEWNRWSINLLKLFGFPSITIEMMVRVIFSSTITFLLVWLVVYQYFTRRIGYSPNMEELTLFLAIYGVISVIYLVLYYGHFTLYRINTGLLQEEEFVKEELKQLFASYIRDINPSLLYESLENIIVALRRSDTDKVDDITDRMSYLYRYILARRDKELVPLGAECDVIENLVELYNLFPFRSIQLSCTG